jgi:hypothetical protein
MCGNIENFVSNCGTDRETFEAKAIQIGVDPSLYNKTIPYGKDQRPIRIYAIRTDYRSYPEIFCEDLPCKVKRRGRHTIRFSKEEIEKRLAQ